MALAVAFAQHSYFWFKDGVDEDPNGKVNPNPNGQLDAASLRSALTNFGRSIDADPVCSAPATSPGPAPVNAELFLKSHCHTKYYHMILAAQWAHHSFSNPGNPDVNSNGIALLS